mgnify:CR=1 FL=1
MLDLCAFELCVVSVMPLWAWPLRRTMDGALVVIATGLALVLTDSGAQVGDALAVESGVDAPMDS